jgi:hypothetical protein
MAQKLSPEEWFSVKTLQSRGWTETLIRQYLGAPDQTVTNPHYRSGPPMRFYARLRVEAVEASAEWANTQQRLAQRKASAAKAVHTKTEALRNYVAALTIEVPILTKAQLIQQACDHYNDRLLDRERWDADTAAPDADPAFLARISVNYLRHVLSPYETELARIYGKTGVREAYLDLNEKIYEAIGDAYQDIWWEIVGECDRQYQTKLDQEAMPRVPRHRLGPRDGGVVCS